MRWGGGGEIHWCQSERECEALKGSEHEREALWRKKKRKCLEGMRDKEDALGWRTALHLSCALKSSSEGKDVREKRNTPHTLTLPASFYGVLFHFQRWMLRSHKSTQILARNLGWEINNVFFSCFPLWKRMRHKSFYMGVWLETRYSFMWTLNHPALRHNRYLALWGSERTKESERKIPAR